MELPEGLSIVPMTDAVLRLQPGDIVVIRSDEVLTEPVRQAIKESVGQAIEGTGAKVLVLDAGMALNVLRPD